MHLVQSGETHKLPCRRVEENDCLYFSKICYGTRTICRGDWKVAGLIV